MPMVSINNLSHRYGDRLALKSVSLHIDAGKIFGFVGPNGGGKTTLFKILSTLLKPISENVPHIEISGTSIMEDPDGARRCLGVVFQAPSLDKKLSVYENLKYQAYLYGMKGALLSQRVADVLERMHLTERKAERVETLSGGLKRRCEIAKALLHQPKILLLDEPTTGLDPGMRLEIWNLLKTLQITDRVTSLISTHLMEEAEKCDEIVILHEGRMVAQGTAETLRHEILGDILTIKTAVVKKLQDFIETKYQIQCHSGEGWLRVEHPSAKTIMMELSETAPVPIDAMTVARPTLEDVFLRKTGQRFHEEKP